MQVFALLHQWRLAQPERMRSLLRSATSDARDRDVPKEVAHARTVLMTQQNRVCEPSTRRLHI